MVDHVENWAFSCAHVARSKFLSATGLVRSSFMERASFLGEGGPARRKQVEGVLSSGLYGVVQARAFLLLYVSL